MITGVASDEGANKNKKKTKNKTKQKHKQNTIISLLA
jgi:hypothetical protein